MRKIWKKLTKREEKKARFLRDMELEKILSYSHFVNPLSCSKKLVGLEFLLHRDKGELNADFNEKFTDKYQVYFPESNDQRISLATMRNWAEKYENDGLDEFLRYLDGSESRFRKYELDIYKGLQKEWARVIKWKDLYNKLIEKFPELKKVPTTEAVGTQEQLGDYRNFILFCERTGIKRKLK